MRLLIRCAVLLAILGSAALGAAAPASAAVTSGDLYILQGVPNQNVDLYVNDRRVGSSVAPTTIVGPLVLDAGTYRVRATAPGGTNLIERGLTITGGRSLDAVLHLDAQASAAPVVTLFPNDLSPVPANRSRLAIAHTASVPAADIRVAGKVLFANVANGEGLTTVVPAASYPVDVVPTGTDGPPLIGPATFTLKPGSLTRVFAIGQPTTTGMKVIVQTLRLGTFGAAAPSLVDTGSGGLAADRHPGSAVPLAIGAAVLVATVLGVLLRTRSRRR